MFLDVHIIYKISKQEMQCQEYFHDYQTTCLHLKPEARASPAKCMCCVNELQNPHQTVLPDNDEIK